MSSLSRANSGENAALPQPPKDNTVKLANLWERMAGKDESHAARIQSSPSPNTITVVASSGAPAVERAPSLGAAGRAPSLGTSGRAPSVGAAGRAPSHGVSGRMPPRPSRSGTRELIDALERRCSADSEAGEQGKGNDKDKDKEAEADGNVSQLVRRLSSAEVDARAEQAVDAAALADMSELKQLVERMTRRVSDLEHKIDKLQAAVPARQSCDCDSE